MVATIYKQLATELANGNKAVLLTIINKAGNQAGCRLSKRLLATEQIINPPDDIDPGTFNIAREAFATGAIQRYESAREIRLVEPFFPVPRLIIMGGGHIALPLAEYGAKLGFAVTVVDDRPDFANKTRFPQARQIICADFTQCFSGLNLNQSAFVVIVTRGHQHDFICLQQALRHEVAYLGMIGSRNKVQGIRRQLLEQACDPDKLNKLFAPIGLEIGAVTPEEIAISILAQVIAVRRRQPEAAAGKLNWPDYDEAVVKQLAGDNNGAVAAITITSTQGSVPRKAGAKMLVWPDGRTLGSIGGGYGEAALIAIAREVALAGGYKIHRLDLSGRVAEEAGMTCGGTLEVIIEGYQEARSNG